MMWRRTKQTIVLLSLAVIQSALRGQTATDPFAPLTIYNGTWTVHAAHPWGGGPPGTADHLVSRCQRFTEFFACEQTVDDKAVGLIVYTIGSSAGKLHSRFIAPDGLAGGRGDFILDGSHWTYLDKPPKGLTGKWSRVENYVLNHDHIRFEEYESADEGKSWIKKNSGTEDRDA